MAVVPPRPEPLLPDRAAQALSPAEVLQLQRTVGNRATRELVQQKALTGSAAAGQPGGLPAQLGRGIERLSGVSMRDVRVHQQSQRPAELGALAFASGSEIFLGPGQEQHLPHEAWHVVQQAQGRVAPTAQLRRRALNDDAALEREADQMGARALALGALAVPVEPRLRPASGAGAAPVQRVVGPRPAGAFAADATWAAWFAAMTEAEVASEAASLGLSRAQLESLNGKLAAQAIQIPAAYGAAAPSAAPAVLATTAVAASSHDPESGIESPFLLGSRPAVVDFSALVPRGKKARRRELVSPVQFSIVRRTGSAAAAKVVYAPEARPRSLSGLEKAAFDFCWAHSADFVLTASGKLALCLEPGRYVVFTPPNVELVGEEFAALYSIRYEEPEPRSGKARAAADALAGQERPARDDEAPYARPVSALGGADEYEDYAEKQGGSTFQSQIAGGWITNTVVHRGPWAKGERVPSQMGVMGGQNAKNYFLDQYIFDGEADPVSDAKRAKAVEKLGGRFEWLHIIGSSLGGLNVLGNLVAGTYDANTLMIALEHRVALWGAKGYHGPSQPTVENPIQIVGEAQLVNNKFIATQIVLTVLHGGEQVASGKYETLDPKVLTKSQYLAEERRVAAQIKASRGEATEVEADSGSATAATSAAAATTAVKPDTDT